MSEMEKKATAKAKKTVTSKSRRVSAKRKKTRLKEEMAKQRIEEKHGLEPEPGLVCMGERCWIYRMSKRRLAGKATLPGWCPRAKEGGECGAMF